MITQVLPNVSVVVPVFEDQLGINACLTGLALQDYPAHLIEVIIVDNLSSPQIEIPATFSQWVRLVVCERPGSYAARNMGLAAAKGSIIALTDADCVPSANWLAAGIASFAEHETDCIIGGEVQLVRSHQPTAVEEYQCIIGFMQSRNISELGFGATANMFFPRRLATQVGPFAEDLLSGGDRDWCWRAASAGFPIHYCKDSIVRTNPRTSLSSAIRQARRIAGGRYQMRRATSSTHNTLGLSPIRGPLDGTKWILAHPDLTWWSRAKVLAVATVLKFSHIVETLRLKLGGAPERR